MSVNIGNRYRNAQVELFGEDDPLACDVVPGQAVVGGRIVKLVTGGLLKVETAGAADEAALGVAMYDVGASDTERKLSVAVEGAWYLIADGSITAGDSVESAADGAVSTASTGKVLGTALADALDTEPVPVLLRLA